MNVGVTSVVPILTAFVNPVEPKRNPVPNSITKLPAEISLGVPSGLPIRMLKLVPSADATAAGAPRTFAVIVKIEGELCAMVSWQRVTGTTFDNTMTADGTGVLSLGTLY